MILKYNNVVTYNNKRPLKNHISIEFSKQRSHVNGQINDAIVLLIVLIMDYVWSGQLFSELFAELLQGRKRVVASRFHLNSADVTISLKCRLPEMQNYFIFN